jgi:hypothetical protein
VKVEVPQVTVTLWGRYDPAASAPTHAINLADSFARQIDKLLEDEGRSDAVKAIASLEEMRGVLLAWAAAPSEMGPPLDPNALIAGAGSEGRHLKKAYRQLRLFSDWYGLWQADPVLLGAFSHLASILDAPFILLREAGYRVNIVVRRFHYGSPLEIAITVYTTLLPLLPVMAGIYYGLMKISDLDLEIRFRREKKQLEREVIDYYRLLISRNAAELETAREIPRADRSALSEIKDAIDKVLEYDVPSTFPFRIERGVLKEEDADAQDGRGKRPRGEGEDDLKDVVA